MVRWELYVNFFYSWIIFSLRCHHLNFQYYIEMNIHHRVTAFERSAGKKKKKPTQTRFLPPLSAALNMHSSLWLAKQHSASVCPWAQSLSFPGIPPGTSGTGGGGLMGVQHKCKSFQGWDRQKE